MSMNLSFGKPSVDDDARNGANVPGPCKDVLWSRAFMDDGVRRMTVDGGILRPEDFTLRARLVELRQEHRDLDQAIEDIMRAPAPDFIRLQRMKKRKLLLKDEIAALEDQRRPDIIA